MAITRVMVASMGTVTTPETSAMTVALISSTDPENEFHQRGIIGRPPPCASWTIDGGQERPAHPEGAARCMPWEATLPRFRGATSISKSAASAATPTRRSPWTLFRRPKTTPIHELERYMRCKDCSEVRGYPYKRSHLVALRRTKISASDPPSYWWPGER